MRRRGLLLNGAAAALAARLEGLGYSLVAGTPEDFTATIRRDTARWRGVIERAGIRAE